MSVVFLPTSCWATVSKEGDNPRHTATQRSGNIADRAPALLTSGLQWLSQLLPQTTQSWLYGCLVESPFNTTGAGRFWSDLALSNLSNVFSPVFSLSSQY